MHHQNILFFTTNSIWGGSEVLWTSSAKKLKHQGYEIYAVAAYDFKLIEPYQIQEKYFFKITTDYQNLSLQQRIQQKLRLTNYSIIDNLKKFVASSKPVLAVISQGNNTEGMHFMELCAEHKIAYITITHLVVESLWPAQNDEKLNRLYELFNKSIINFFVSKQTLRLHEKFTGYKCDNSKLIYNPFIKKIDEVVNYPGLINGKYTVALLGRLENFHKGYDLLIDVLSNEKWKQRNIVFTIYGNGPHLQLINRLIKINKVENLIIKEYVEDIAQVWREHHILLMPSRLEGQSLTLIEAMRFKRTAIVTQVGGIEELIDEGITGFIAEFPEVKAIDNAMERAWSKRLEWEQMGLDAYQYILERHPDDAVVHFINQLKAVLGNN